MPSPGTPDAAPLVGIIMGSRSDWETMRHAAEILTALEVRSGSRRHGASS
ncbi:MAG: AIR carboxylase family protein, partial [Roseomonas mucosa]|nr:AIR carboxylase family protein [Roseomonas mucosa]